jgi:hypothetical protein
MTSSRWETALHEAGHVVAGTLLLRDTKCGAVVLESAGGMAFINVSEPLRTFNEALAIAAGSAAGELADRYPVPATEPAPVPAVRKDASPHQTSYPALSAMPSIPDSVRLARWCCEQCPDEPDRWAKRHVWIQREAEFFVRDHAQEIVAFATQLYVHGFFTQSRMKPEQPTGESTHDGKHVDSGSERKAG